MEISTYEVGDIPAPLAIDVRDGYGRPVNCSAYTGFEVIMLDGRNQVVDLSGSSLDTSAAQLGRFVLTYPSDRSVFTKTGDYVLQLRLSGNGRVEHTTAHNFRVRQMGKVNK